MLVYLFGVGGGLLLFRAAFLGFLNYGESGGGSSVALERVLSGVELLSKVRVGIFQVVFVPYDIV